MERPRYPDREEMYRGRNVRNSSNKLLYVVIAAAIGGALLLGYNVFVTDRGTDVPVGVQTITISRTCDFVYFEADGPVPVICYDGLKGFFVESEAPLTETQRGEK
jgi:hypothetical protein